MKLNLYILLCVVCFMPGVFGGKESPMVTYKDIMSLKPAKADHRIFYGKKENQFGELRMPKGKGKHPLVIVIHGGCWTSKIAQASFMDPFCEALSARGFATWNIEYRCIDNGGGWPETFLDVGAAVDYVRVLAKTYSINVDNVVIVGHSSGGHLALWAAGRGRLSKESPLYVATPLKPRGVINLAGHGNLKEFESVQVAACGAKVLDELFKCSNLSRAEMYRDASPYLLLPLGVRQIVMAGSSDVAAPAELMRRYVDQALKAGDAAEFVALDGGHFDLIMPKTKAFEDVLGAISSLFD